MKTLDIGYINRLSPYGVWTKDGKDFRVKTANGNIFMVGFVEDYSIWPTGAYQLTIINESNLPSPNDPKLKETIFRIVEAFFMANSDILLYVCETGDGKQAFRSRLFVRWFNSYLRRDDYVLQTAELQAEDVMNFAALIVQRSNPRLQKIIAEFNETIDLLSDKPE